MSNGATSESDDALLAAVQQHDEQGIAALYDRYNRLAFGLAYRILGERGLAEDVVQDAFMSVWWRAGSYELGKGSVRTWLLSIVHHRAIDRLRGTAGRARQDQPLDDVVAVLAVEDSWREVALRVQQDVLRQTMAALPEPQRQTIEQVYFGGYTQQEVADMMGVPVGTVKGRLRIGLQKLRESLANTGIQ